MTMNSEMRNESALLRRELGDVLREYRQRQGRTLREVSSDARVSLGYLSEVERGQKEASSELLDSICHALNVPLSHVLRLVADRVDRVEGRIPPIMRRPQPAVQIPDSVPESLVAAELAAMRG
ncbi:helix-turn-helix domain-containing protein [Arcanobacterium pluranimalium]|uniref:helix-turn-helix domain-containing protein n=1 Tax=Arcanobacterium pluranimalium TaxID=108028 RepID=UPI0023BB0C0C|nr:helix-turn-helix transcriptional regulator [Arcanobacterium pluranimalium]